MKNRLIEIPYRKIFSLFFRNQWESLLALILLVLYVFLFGHYLINDIDSAWTTAWIYNFTKYGISRDILFAPDDANYWGVRFFSHAFCYVYGAILSIIGFGRLQVMLISNIFGAASLITAYFVAKKILQKKQESLHFVLLLAGSTLFFAAANKARTDMFVLFFILLSLLLLANKKYFFSVISACVALETHPVAILCVGYIGAYILVYDRDLLKFNNKRAIAEIAAGLLLGMTLYFLMHRVELTNLSGMINRAIDSKNFLIAHFFGRNSFAWRYWPDLGIFIAAALISAYSCLKSRKISFPFLASFFLIIISIFLKRGNFHYAIFCYPAFLLLTVEIFDRYHLWKIPLLLTFFIGIQLPQYGYLVKKRFQCRDYEAYQTFLSSLPLPNEAVIYGSPTDWFALQGHRNFHSITSYSKGRQEAFYLIEHSNTYFGITEQIKVDKSGLSVMLIDSYCPASGGRINVSFLTKENMSNDNHQ